MFKGRVRTVFCTIAILVLGLCTKLSAEINFDFALPLFKQEEVNFEKTKPTDYNLQLLKKYILEHDSDVLAQFHAINRWFTLIKLSDTPRHAELLAAGNKYFSTKDKKKPTQEEKLREIFYAGLLLQSDKAEDPENKKDQEFEELLLDNEDDLAENANYWIAKGIIFNALRDRPNNYFQLMKPEEDLKAALTIIPKTAQYYYVMGQCFRYIGGSESALFLAIASYEKASSLDPHNQKLQNSLLSIYMGLHEEYQQKNKQEPFWLEEAVYKKILEMSPGNPHALNNLGYLYAEYGVNTQTAQDLCQRAVDFSPENPGFYDSLGWAAFKNRNYQLAEESLQKSIEMRGNVYESHNHLATVYYSTKQLDKAAEQYEIAVKLRPDSAETLNNLAYLYTEQNKNAQEALKMAVTANELEPNNASYLDTLGWAYYRNGDLENALTNLQKANNLVPGQGEILLHLGRVYLDKNEFENALTFVKEAFKSAPGMEDPDETLYLTIRLKAYHEAMADYHGLLGEKADKEKVINILTGISRLYQEEGLYEKSIEITRICSDLQKGLKTLKEPLLNSYKLHYAVVKETQNKPKAPVKESSEEADQDEEDDNEEEVSETEAKEEEDDEDEDAILEPEEETEKPSSAAPSVETAPKSSENKTTTDSNIITLPAPIKYPVAVSFCSELFKAIGEYVPKLNGYKDCNVTIFIDRFIAPSATAITRIESDKNNATELQQAIINMFGYKKEKSQEISPDNCQIKLISGNYYSMINGNAVYFSKNKLTQEIVDSLANVLPYRKGYMLEFYIDWNEFKTRIPQLVVGFISNPVEPFTRLQSSYTYTDDVLNEFIIGSTGKTEDDAFMKKLARRLFQFKLDAKNMNLPTTIKMQQEKDMVYISTDFEQPLTWLSQKVDLLNSRIKSLLPIIKQVLPADK